MYPKEKSVNFQKLWIEGITPVDLRYPMYNRVFLHSASIISIVKYSQFYAW